MSSIFGIFGHRIDFRGVRAGRERERERAALAASWAFSALALESAINHYVARRGGPRHLDQFNTMTCKEQWKSAPGPRTSGVPPTCTEDCHADSIGHSPAHPGNV